MGAWWLLVASAGASPWVARPIVVDTAFPAAVHQASGGEVSPRCEPLGPWALCFRVRRGDEERWVELGERRGERWRRDALARAPELARAAGAWLQVVGGSQRFLQVADAEGGAAALLLHPEILADRLGGDDLRVAAPNVDVLLAWVGGDAELDQVMAVGAFEMMTRQPRPISAVVLRWDGRTWAPFAEAVPRP